MMTMTHWLRKKPAAWLAAGVAMGLLVGIGLLVGSIVGFRSAAPQVTLPETILHAEAAVGSDKMAVATGAIDEEVEGFFTLDFLTGELSCFVIYTKGPMAQKLGAIFKTNVTAAFGGVEQGKQPHYLLVTGRANFIRAGGSGNVRPAYSVCYVVDTNTGNWVAYGLPWNIGSMARGQAQQEQFVVLARGKVRAAELRE
jgi:hypothetical protein